MILHEPLLTVHPQHPEDGGDCPWATAQDRANESDLDMAPDRPGKQGSKRDQDCYNRFWQG